MVSLCSRNEVHDSLFGVCRVVFVVRVWLRWILRSADILILRFLLIILGSDLLLLHRGVDSHLKRCVFCHVILVLVKVVASLSKVLDNGCRLDISREPSRHSSVVRCILNRVVCTSSVVIIWRHCVLWNKGWSDIWNVWLV